MPLIFVNYRTHDEEATATLIDQELSRAFGSENVFRASKSIGPGSRYPQELLRAVRRSSVLVAVIGPKWLEAGGADGRSSLEDTDDWTRREILEALETGAFVIPLLVGGAKRLAHEDLPMELAELADCQYRRFNHRNAEADLARLVDDLVRLLPELEAAARRHGHESRPEASGNRASQGGDGSGAARPGTGRISHHQQGGIGNLNGGFSGTFLNESQGPVHTGSGNLYQAREQSFGPRISGDGGINYVAENHGTAHQRSNRSEHPVDGER
ncbi:toll/interleukin-1 receptor domain-containing protein [Streptomyces sp. NPDC057499]|uniref:toll/interleukin-1 receptor domain-containing protein n=1 Tax=Streptomyces sp. NPDC057499 TaxID=3346150 RepID=UPI00368E77D0